MATSETKPTSYAEISRKAGFGSRNYARELANGNRKLSLNSLRKLIRALGLKGDGAKLFERLAYRENPSLCAGDFDPRDNLNQLNRYRERLRNRSRLRRHFKDTTIFQIQDWPVVYAALGSLDLGATLEDVRGRTGFSLNKCERILGDMGGREIVVRENDRYRALNGHLIFAEQTAPSAFQVYFQNGLKRVLAASQTHFASEQHLFYGSSFSVPCAKIPELKRRLRDLLIEFTDAHEEPAGDTVASVVCGLIALD